MTQTICDLCKEVCEPLSLILDTMQHDLCSECHGKLKEMLAGTGRPFMGTPKIDLADLFQTPALPQKVPYTYPPYLGNGSGSPEFWKDQIIGTGITYGMNSATYPPTPVDPKNDPTSVTMGALMNLARAFQPTSGV